MRCNGQQQVQRVFGAKQETSRLYRSECFLVRVWILVSENTQLQFHPRVFDLNSSHRRFGKWIDVRWHTQTVFWKKVSSAQARYGSIIKYLQETEDLNFSTESIRIKEPYIQDNGSANHVGIDILVLPAHITEHVYHIEIYRVWGRRLTWIPHIQCRYISPIRKSWRSTWGIIQVYPDRLG